MKRNIVIIGSVKDSYTVDQQISWSEVLDNVNVIKLDQHYRDLYFKYLHRDIKEFITFDKARPELKTFKALLDFLDRYLNDGIFNEHEFNLAVAEIDKKEWYYKFLSNRRSSSIAIENGTTLIHVPGHICNTSSVLIIPLIIDCIKHLDKPILACSQDFLTDCDRLEFYKISNKFFKHIKLDCQKHGIRYFEYTGDYFGADEKPTFAPSGAGKSFFTNEIANQN